jgi:hypothetical protein
MFVMAVALVVVVVVLVVAVVVAVVLMIGLNVPCEVKAARAGGTVNVTGVLSYCKYGVL